MSYREKHYPMGGSIHWGTTDMIVSRSFRVDAGAQAAGTDTTETFRKGDAIFGFRVHVTEAVTSGGSATVQFGFSSTTMLSAAIAKATLVIGYCVGADATADAAPLILSADDTFDIIVGVATLTAGQFDIDVYYAPATYEPLGSEFKEYTTT